MVYICFVCFSFFLPLWLKAYAPLRFYLQVHVHTYFAVVVFASLVITSDHAALAFITATKKEGLPYTGLPCLIFLAYMISQSDM